MSWLLARLLAIISSRATIGVLVCLSTCATFANPVVDNIAAGQVNIQQNANSTVINQSSQKAIINWQSFNIGQQESTHFNQPAGGIALNRISPTQGASQIYGSLTATGQIILVNPAGIYFGPSAFVNVGGLVATTHDISDANFLSGNYSFNKVDPYSGAVINEGTIVASQNGLVALVAPAVVNKGMIQANLGKVVLASGDAFTMSFDGSGLINFTIDAATTSRGHDHNRVELADGITNTGSIIANGGTVLVTGKAAANVLDRVINMDGLVQTQSVLQHNGEIILSADTDADNNNIIRLAGALDASGRTAGLIGGNVTITAKYILADSGTNVDVSGDAGGGNIFVGGNYLGQGPLPNATAVVTAENTHFNASAITNGNGGNVIFWSDNYTNVNSAITARGGSVSGNGGFIETSSKNILNIGNIVVDAGASAGQAGNWLLDPWDVTISNAANANPNIFANPFDATGTGSNVNITSLQTALASADVTITTGATGGESGNITVVDPISWASSFDLTLTAANSIFLNAAITTGDSSSLLILNAPNAITQTTAIGGSGGIVKQGAGTFTASAINTYTGSTTINAGAISIAADSGLGAAPGSPTASHLIFNGGTLITTSGLTLHANRGVELGASGGTINADANTTIAGQITGVGALNATSSNASELILSGDNTYSGITTINSNAIITATHDNALGSTAAGTNVLNGGSLHIDNVHIGDENITVAGSGQSFGGSIRIFNNAALDGDIISAETIFLSARPGSVFDLYGAISTPNALSLISSGTVVLYNTANTFTGVTMMGNGTLQWGASDVIPDTANIFFTAGMGNLLDINGFNDTIGYLDGGNSMVQNIQLNGGGTLTVNQTTNATFDGGIGGDGNFVKTGASTLTLSSVNHSYTGTTTILAGTLRLTAANGIQNSSAVTLANTTGAILNLNNNNNIINNLSGGGTSGGNIALGSATMTINQSTDQSYGGVISGTGGIIKEGANALTLSNSNTFSGGTVLNDGTLSVGNNTALGSGTLTYNSGTLASSANTSLANNVLLNASMVINNNNDLTLSGIINDAASSFALTKSGSGALTLSGSNTFDGGVTLTAGTLTVNSTNALGTGDLTYTGGTLTFGPGSIILPNAIVLMNNMTFGGSNDFSLNGAISESGGSYGITKDGSSIMTLLTQSNYSGTTDINAGTLRFGTNVFNALPNNSDVDIAAGATLDMGNFGGGIGNLSGAGTIVMSSFASLEINLTRDSTFSGDIIGTGDNIFIQSNDVNNVLTVSGTISADVSNGTGLAIRNATLQLGANNVINGSNYIYSDTNGTFDLNGFSDTVRGLNTVDTNSRILLGSGTLTIDTNLGFDHDYLGVISGTGNIIKTGVDEQDFFANNTYSGTTTINQGTLSVWTSRDSLGNSSSITVNNGGTLEVNGGGTLTNANNMYLNGNGYLASGQSTGALYLRGGTLNNSITLQSDSLIRANSGDSNINGVITGTGGLISSGGSGGGTLVLNAVNTYSGNTTINSGTIRLGIDGALPTATNLTIGALSSGTFEMNGFSNTIASLLANPNTATIDFGFFGTSTLTINQASNQTFSGSITGVGNIVKAGSSALTLSGSSSYSGTTTLVAGTLNIDNNDALGTSVLNMDGGTLTANTSGISIANDFTVGGSATIGGSNDITLAGAGSFTSGTLTVSNTTTTTLSGALSGGANLTQTNGSLILSNSNGAYNGTVTLTNGTLQVANATDALGTGTLALNGGTLLSSVNAAIGNAVTAAGGVIGNGSDLTFNSTVTLNNTLAINNAANTLFNGIVSGASGITQSTGNVTLAAANTYDGATSVTGGTLNVTHAQGLGTTTGSTTIANAAITFNTLTNSEALSLNNASLTTTGNVTLNGAMTLAASSTNTMSAGSTLTLGSNINGAGTLTLDGAGDYILNGNVGNSTALASFTTNVATSLGGASNTINAGSVVFNNTLNGGSDLTINSSGATSLSGAVGQTVALNSININASSINIDGGAVRTVNDQVYNASVALGADTTFTHTGTGTRTFNFTNGISGNRNIILNGGNSADTSFNLTGALAANNITINGGAAGNNTFAVNSNTNQDWNINAANGGTLSNVSGVAGTFGFNNIRSLVGGNLNDSFVLNGGSLTGSINAGGGTNTLTAANGANTWNLSGTNAASNMTGVAGGFSNIQNLVGGTGNDNFIFANNTLITGTISGGVTLTNTGDNILDFTAYSTALNANMTSGTNEFIGNVRNSGNSVIANYNNIDRLVGNQLVDNTITLPTGKDLSVVTFTPGFNNRVGFIGDPLYFDYWRILSTTPPPDPTPIPTPTGTTTDVAQIIQQPTTNGTNNANAPVSATSSWVLTNSTLTQNITSITEEAASTFDTELEGIKINPYCTSAIN